MIQIKNYKLDNLYLTNGLIAGYIIKFWKDVYSKIDRNDSHLMILVKVQFTESEMGFRTLGHLRRVNFDDREMFIEYLAERLSILHDSYTTLSISKIVFNYIIKEGLAVENKLLLSNVKDTEQSYHRFNNMNLPVTMDPYLYGEVKSVTQTSEFMRYIVRSTINKFYEIDVSLDKLINKVTLLGASELKWIDTAVSDGCFKREIQKSTIYFLDGEEVLRKQLIPSKPFKKLNVEKSLQSRFVTMDIETTQRDHQLVPYLINAYNGTDHITSYVDSNMNQKALFHNFIISLLTFFTKESTKLIVYAHNLSGFDGIFLMQHLLSFGKVKPLIFEGQIKSIELRLNIVGYLGKTIVFKDSYQLLPYSLRTLCKAFNVIIPKGWFPFKLSDIFYKGVLPALQYWNITIEEFEVLAKKYTGLTWNFKDEAIKYCKLDCQCLHEILVKFNEIMYKKFNISIHSSLTAPSLSMRLFKTNFMPENTIFSLHGKVEQDIRQSYTGGAVDVYIPHNKIGSFFSKTWRTLFYYDVNSLYPTVMSRGDMPIGAPIVFEGDIRAIEPEAYGFFYCKITSPDNLEHPLLQRRIETSEGTRTIAGLGTWHGWICSIEMDNAIKFNYQFEIIKGYQFEKGNIFKEFIDTMYQLRLEYPVGHPMNLIAKLMMNSLYGKFGMKDQFSVVEIFKIKDKNDKKAFRKLVDLWGNSIQDWIVLEDHLVVIRDKVLDLKTDPEDAAYSFGGTEINIAIASAITAYARSFMSYFKNNPEFHLYYSDTDSVIIDKALPANLIGSALGQLKLEYVINKAAFIAPKVYALITDTGEEVIKIKGINHTAIVNENIHFTDILNLLIQDSQREFTQEKWYKNVMAGTITVTDIAYTLKVTSNKRQSIYVDGIYESTTPYFYNEIENKKD
jgi:DNA polymerase type B, organellar and viral